MGPHVVYVSRQIILSLSALTFRFVTHLSERLIEGGAASFPACHCLHDPWA